MNQFFRKIKTEEIAFAKKLVKKAFPYLKHVKEMKRTGDSVFCFGKFKIDLQFPREYYTCYQVSIIKYADRWCYQVIKWTSDESWESVDEVIKWIHPDTDEVYDDRQILIDEYRTLPYIDELKERHNI